MDLVEDSLVWMKQSKDLLELCQDRDSEYLLNLIKNLVFNVSKIQAAVDDWNERYAISHLAFSSQDEQMISDLFSEHKNARDNLSFHAHIVTSSAVKDIKSEVEELKSQVMTMELDKIREVFERAFIYFDSDLETHLSRFIPGSREWMHKVSSSSIRCHPHIIMVSNPYAMNAIL
jgi:hypothetical protein